MSTVASVTTAIRANLTLTLGAVGAGFTPARQRAAAAWFASYLARVHGDPTWLCSTTTDPAVDPTVAAATAGFAK
jgi:hypothetical protein